MKETDDRTNESDGNRRGLLLSLLGLGAASAVGCVAQAADPRESLGQTAQALSGAATVEYADTIGTAASPADLRGLTGAAGSVAVVNGFASAGDGGGGVFYWDAASVAADDGGTIIQATGVTTGRWRRIYSGALNVRWFGAGCGGGYFTDDEAPIQAALSALQITGSSALYLPAGRYTYATSPNFAVVTSTNFPLFNTKIFGDPGTVLVCTGGHSAFVLDGDPNQVGDSVSNITVENLIVQATGSSTSNNNGFYVHAISRSRFNSLHVAGAAACGVLIQYCDSLLWNQLVVSSNEVYPGLSLGLSPVPQVAVYLTEDTYTHGGAPGRTTYLTFIDPVLQGPPVCSPPCPPTGYGMVIDWAHGTTVIGGTINNWFGGVSITNGDQNGFNSFHGTHFEWNGTWPSYPTLSSPATDGFDMAIGSECTLLSNISTGGGANGSGMIWIRGSGGLANHTQVLGGVIGQMLIESGSYRTKLLQTTILTLSDNGTSTVYQQAYNIAAYPAPPNPFTDSPAQGSAATLLTPLAPSFTIDARYGNIFLFPLTTPNPVFTIPDPVSPKLGQIITISVKNATGAAVPFIVGCLSPPITGCISWGSAYRMADWTSALPGGLPDGYSISVDFYFNGTNWIEKSRTPNPVPN